MGSHSNVRTAMTRGCAALMATVAVFSTATTAMSAPADVFSSPAPVAGSDPPKAAELRAGEAAVSTQTGAMQYSYPISLPPGRGGMVPSVSLNYSSQAPLYGTIAAGWSLSMPAIREDTSQGRLRTHAPEVEAAQGPVAALIDDRYISTMAGNRPLILVDEPSAAGVAQVFRAQNDSSFTRYQRMDTFQTPGFFWRAYTTSGTEMKFGEISRMGGCPNVGLGYAPLTSERDPFGNEIAYEYEWISKMQDCRIKQITWGMNATAGIGAIARVVFGWAEGSSSGGFYAGSQRDYRTGKLRVTGGSRLDTITATAFPSGAPGSPDHTRVITLAYEASAELNTGNLTHAPHRLLKSIQESAWRTGQTAVNLPPVTFTYAPPMTDAAQVQSNPPWLVIPGGGAGAGHTKNLGWGFRHPSPGDDRWPTVEAMMVDLDGDGLLDRLVNTSNGSSNGNCTAEWQRNAGPDPAHPGELLFEPTPRTLTLPRLKWGGSTAGASSTAARRASPWLEGCSLNGQATAYFNVTSVAANVCHDGQLCQASTDPERGGAKFCNRTPTPPNGKTGTACPLDPGGGGGTAFRTYLAYRFMDADGDGITDLVTAVHGDIDTYDIEQGIPSVLEPVPFNLGSWPACPGMQICKDLGSCLGEYQSCPANTVCPTNWTLVNSCLTSAPALACFSILARMPASFANGPVQRTPYTRCEGLYPWFIYKNQGNGVFPTTPTVKYQPLPLESDLGDSAIGGPNIFAQSHAVTDFDGDGWLDGIAHGEETTNGNPNAWYVWLGDGTGGMGPKRYIFPTRPHAGDNNRIAASDPVTSVGQRMGTLDLNGDGLPDHWLAEGSAANITFHDGSSFAGETGTGLMFR